MLPRIMPCLLLSDGALVKTRKFGGRQYIGDPVNTINIFNRLEVDELVLLDIDATPRNQPVALDLIAEVASECTAPLTYGGGIRSKHDVHQILSVGVEKVVINTSAARDRSLISEAAAKFGSQAIVVSVDARRGFFGKYSVYCESGRKSLAKDLLTYIAEVEEAGAGEIFLNSIDRDGMMAGFDIELIKMVTSRVNIPVIACGGAGKRVDLIAPVRDGGASAVAAGSLFVFQNLERGVLINFPTRRQIEELFK
jgi:imidazole glycerol-phosphate synthase subunit HisF